jgi:hypothetical protein
MRTTTKLFLALGLAAGAATLTLPGMNTAKAQGLYVDAPGVHVGVGHRHHRYYRDYDYRDYRYGRGHRAYGYDRGYPYGSRHNYGSAGCPFNYTVQDGVCKPYTGR